MRAVILAEHVESMSTHVGVALASNPRATPGWMPAEGGLHLQITGVPDDTPNHEVIRRYNASCIWMTLDEWDRAGYRLPYEVLGRGGEIVKYPHVVGASCPPDVARITLLEYGYVPDEIEQYLS